MPEFYVTVYGIDGVAWPHWQPTGDNRPLAAEDVIDFLRDVLLKNRVGMVNIGNAALVPLEEGR